MSDRNDFARMSDSALGEWHLLTRTVDELRSQVAQLTEQLVAMSVERDLARRALDQQGRDHGFALIAAQSTLALRTMAHRSAAGMVVELLGALGPLWLALKKIQKGDKSPETFEENVRAIEHAGTVLEKYAVPVG